MPAWSEVVDELTADQWKLKIERERAEIGRDILLGKLIRASVLMSKEITGGDLTDDDIAEVSEALALAVEADECGAAFYSQLARCN